MITITAEAIRRHLPDHYNWAVSTDPTPRVCYTPYMPSVDDEPMVALDTPQAMAFIDALRLPPCITTLELHTSIDAPLCLTDPIDLLQAMRASNIFPPQSYTLEYYHRRHYQQGYWRFNTGTYDGHDKAKARDTLITNMYPMPAIIRQLHMTIDLSSEHAILMWIKQNTPT